MGTRAHEWDHVQDAEGRPIQGVSVHVYEEHTTTPISETIYAEDSDHADAANTQSNPLTTSSNGRFDIYLASEKRVTIQPVKTGHTFDDYVLDITKNPTTGLTVEDEGVALANRNTINVTGAGATASDSGGKTVINVPGQSTTVATDTIWDAAGDIVKGTGADTAARVARGTAHQVLKVNSGGTDIEYGVEQARDVVTTAGDITYATAADTLTRLGIGTALQVLRTNAGATAPEWATLTTTLGDLLDYQFVRKSADQSVTSSTVLVNDTHLVQAVGTSQTWEFDCLLRVDAHASGDLKLAFTAPASSTLIWDAVAISDGDALQWLDTVGSGTTRALGGGGAGFVQPFILHGIIRTAGTAGNLQLQFAQNTSNGTATILKTDSYLRMKRVA